MKNKFSISCLSLAVLMLFTLAACGKKGPEKPDPEAGGSTQEDPVKGKNAKTVNTDLWDLTYDEADGWVYEEDDVYDNEDYASISMSIPEEGKDASVVMVDIYVSLEDPGDFRDYLTSYGFDEYEYAVNQAYEFTPVGGIDCLKAEGNYWGSPCLRYLSRVEGASATVLIEIIGEYEDERVDKLLSGLTINLEDTGNVDGPWYWEGEPFSAQPRSAMVGTYTVSSQWLPITDCIVTKETFEHAAAVIGDQVFLLVDGQLKRYDYDGTSLTFAEDIALDGDYEAIFADTAGTIWLSNFMEPLISWKDGAQTASYEGPSYVAMHPSGTWGISWFSGPECEKITLSGGAVSPYIRSGHKGIPIAPHLQLSDSLHGQGGGRKQLRNERHGTGAGKPRLSCLSGTCKGGAGKCLKSIRASSPLTIFWAWMPQKKDLLNPPLPYPCRPRTPSSPFPRRPFVLSEATRSGCMRATGSMIW